MMISVVELLIFQQAEKVYFCKAEFIKKLNGKKHEGQILPVKEGKNFRVTSRKNMDKCRSAIRQTC
ncbi:hypothetical protein KHA80_08400 [Anaerobacillus sp. HL2]|nr:hypothetical protein KHA80_08400 [Anaerobacillus sp. HL2]